MLTRKRQALATKSRAPDKPPKHWQVLAGAFAMLLIVAATVAPNGFGNIAFAQKHPTTPRASHKATTRASEKAPPATTRRAPTTRQAHSAAQNKGHHRARERRKLLAVLEAYRVAILHGNTRLLRQLISPHYYETSGTSSKHDDYDLKGFLARFDALQKRAKVHSFRYKVQQLRWQTKEQVVLRLHIKASYFFFIGKKKRLVQRNTTTQMILAREQGKWKIRSGM